MEFAYRQRYVQLLIKALKENVEKTSSLKLDELTFTHFGMKVEESCTSKVQSTESYTRAITTARVSIERHTANRTLFPMIAEAMLDDTNETSEPNKTTQQQNSAENNNDKETYSTAHTTSNNRTKQESSTAKGPTTQNYTVDNDVIVIDSSDSEDQDECGTGAKIQNGIEGEILFTVQTEPLTDLVTDDGEYAHHTTNIPTEDSSKTI